MNHSEYVVLLSALLNGPTEFCFSFDERYELSKTILRWQQPHWKDLGLPLFEGAHPSGFPDCFVPCLERVLDRIAGAWVSDQQRLQGQPESELGKMYPMSSKIAAFINRAKQARAKASQ